MREDARSLGFEIGSSFKSLDGSFVLPSDFDDSSGRVIALTTAMYYGMCEYHFYVKNGSGTCPNTKNHGGECSMWSHKQAHQTISNRKINSSVLLCDENIYNNANSGIYSNYNQNTDDASVRFYTITKDTYIYNSWHGDGRDEECTGTPYCQ